MDRPGTAYASSSSRSFVVLRRPKTAVPTNGNAGLPHGFVDTQLPGAEECEIASHPSSNFHGRRRYSHEQQEHGEMVPIRRKSTVGLNNNTESFPFLPQSADQRPSPSRLSKLFHHKSRESLAETTKYSAASTWFQRAANATFRGRRKSTLTGSLGSSRRILLEAPERNLSCSIDASAIPIRFRGGDAARAAAAAASSERLDASLNLRPKEVTRVRVERSKSSDDGESGIGIDAPDRTHTAPGMDLGPTACIARIDPATLPEELFHHILTFVDASSLMSAELVSRRWHETAGSQYMWRSLFAREFRQPMATTAQSNTIVPMGSPGLGDLPTTADQAWKRMWQARKALDARWRDGHAAAIYLEGHSDSVYCVQFDEEKIVTGSRDRTIRVWDLHTFACIRVLGQPVATTAMATPPPTCEQMHAQKPFASLMPPLTSCVSPAAQRHRLNHDGSILCLQFDETSMVTGSSDATLILWDLTQDWMPVQRLRRHGAGVLDVCFDSRHIVSCSKDTTICLWDRATGALLRRFTGHLGPVNAVQLRSEHFVSASGDGIAKLWHLASGLCVKEFPSRDRGLACVEFSPDGRTILAGGNDQVIYQFDANTGELVRELIGHASLVRSLHLDAANGRVISGSYDCSVKVFDLAEERDAGNSSQSNTASTGAGGNSALASIGGGSTSSTAGRLICDFQGWTTSWMLAAVADYRRIIATSQDGRVVVMDFGHALRDIDLLEGRRAASQPVGMKDLRASDEPPQGTRSGA